AMSSISFAHHTGAFSAYGLGRGPLFEVARVRLRGAAPMRQITANIFLTLDGVMQAPGRPDEDTRGGFRHGGWGAPYSDAVMMKEMTAGMGKGAGAMLF